jgi:WD40 repeat protein
LATDKTQAKNGSVFISIRGKIRSWYAGGNTNGSIYIWNMQDSGFSKPEYDLQQHGDVLSLDFSPDHRWLASGGSLKFAYIWDMTTGQETARLRHIDEVSSVSFSSDGALLATASKKVVEIWNFQAIPVVTTKDLKATACGRLTSNLNPIDWQTYLPNEPFQVICPELPSSN